MTAAAITAGTLADELDMLWDRYIALSGQRLKLTRQMRETTDPAECAALVEQAGKLDTEINEAWEAHFSR